MNTMATHEFFTDLTLSLMDSKYFDQFKQDFQKLIMRFINVINFQGLEYEILSQRFSNDEIMLFRLYSDYTRYDIEEFIQMYQNNPYLHLFQDLFLPEKDSGIVPESAQSWAEEIMNDGVNDNVELADKSSNTEHPHHSIICDEDLQLLNMLINIFDTNKEMIDTSFLNDDAIIDKLVVLAKKFIQKSTPMDKPCLANDHPVPESASAWDMTPKVGLNQETLGLATKALEVLDDIRKDLKSSSLSESTLPTRLMDSIDIFANVANQASTLNVEQELRNAIKVLKEEVVTTVAEVDYMKHAKNISIVVIFVSSTIAYLVDRTRTNKVLMIVSGICVLMFTNVLTETSLATYIVSLFTTTRDQGPKPEMSDDIVDKGLTGILGFFSSYLIATSGKSVPHELMDHLRNFSRTKSSLKDIVNAVISTIEGVTNWIRQNLMELNPVRFLSTNIYEIDEYLDTAENLLSRNRMGTLHKTPSNLNEITAVIAIGNKIIRNIPRHAQTPGVISVMNSALGSLKKLQAEFAAANIYQGGYRQEPVGVMLHGGPGIGKSLVLEHLARACCSATLSEEHYENFKMSPQSYIYVSNAQAEFWGGFVPTAHVIQTDDFGQFQEAPGKESDASIAIKVGNGFPFPPPMADIDSKGTTWVNAKFMIATTNLSIFNFETVKFNAALDRRWGCRYIMCPKKEFCKNPDDPYMNRTFDYSKLPDYFHSKYESMPKTGSMIPDIQEFIEVDASCTPTGKVLDWNELVSEVVSEYFKRRLWYEAATTQFVQTQERFRKIFETLPRPESEFEEEDIFMEPLDSEVYEMCYNLSSVKAENLAVRVEDLVAKFPKEVTTIYKHINGYLLRKDSALITEKYAQIRTLGPMIYDYSAKDQYEPPLPLLICCFIRDFGREFVDFFAYDEIFSPNFAVFLSDPLPLDIPFSEFKIDRSAWSAFKDYVSYIYNTCKEASFLNTCTTFIENKPFVGMFVVLASSGIVYSLANWVFPEYSDKKADELYTTSITVVKNDSDLMEEVEPQSVDEKVRMREKHKPKNWLNSAKSIKAKFAKPEGGFDSSGESLIDSIIRTNVFIMSYEKDDGSYKEVGCVMFVKGRVALMPYHFIRALALRCDKDDARLKKGIKLVRKNADKPYAFITDAQTVILGSCTDGLEGRDLCLVEFPRTMQPCMNRLENFCEERDLERNSTNIPFVMWLPKSNCKFSAYANASDAELSISSDTTGAYTIRNSYEYPNRTQDGDCGALFCVLNSSIPRRKIFGMHVAGHQNANRSYAAPITKELLLNALDHYRPQLVLDELPEFISPEGDFSGFEQSQFDILGYCEKGPKQPLATEIRRSPLHNTYYKSQMTPAIMHEYEKQGVMINPVKIAMEKYCFNIKHVDLDLVQKARDSYMELLWQRSKEPTTRRIRSFRECIFGLENDPYSKGVVTSTSSGFPYNCVLHEDWYRKMFDARNQNDFDTMEKYYSLIEEEAMQYLDKFRNKIRPIAPYTSNRKDERLPTEKVEAGKLRLFQGDWKTRGAIFDMYFGSFLQWITENRIKNGAYVGVNPYGPEWDEIARDMLRFEPITNPGKCAFDSDFSKFDGSLLQVIMWAFLDIVNEFYDDEHQELREDMFVEVVNSITYSDGYIIMYPCSQPSGGKLTLVLNTIYVQLVYRIAWMIAGLAIYLFNEKVELKSNGDDAICSVHPEYRTKFNAMELPRLMEHCGLEVTSAQKTDAEGAFKKITEIEFNKRSFVYDSSNGRYIAPLRLSTILEIPMWTKKGSEREKIVAQNIITALRELALHERQVYDYWSRAMIYTFRKYCGHLTTTEPLERKWYIRRALVLESESWSQ